MDPVIIDYKEKTYTIPIERIPWLNKHKSKITLYNDQINLGYLEFIPDKNREILYIDSLLNMTNNKNTVRNNDRIPIGTILFETVVQFAKLNGFKKIKLSSLDTAINFYKKKGMIQNNKSPYMILNLLKNQSAEFSYSNNNVTRKRARSRSASRSAYRSAYRRVSKKQ